jgi:L-alanine-DL-glutamate epimerase-like enolase superfamily enzyme
MIAVFKGGGQALISNVSTGTELAAAEALRDALQEYAAKTYNAWYGGVRGDLAVGGSAHTAFDIQLSPHLHTAYVAFYTWLSPFSSPTCVALSPCHLNSTAPFFCRWIAPLSPPSSVSLIR